MPKQKEEAVDLESLGVVKPRKAESFDPVYEVREVKGVRKKGGTYLHIHHMPANAAAAAMGAMTARFPLDLREGSPLWDYAAMIGMDPVKGVDPKALVGIRVRLSIAVAS